MEGDGMAKEENIMIVNPNDECIGSMDKMLVHTTGILHRAFSVLIFDGCGNMLLQQRSRFKYHSPLLWSNACCSHQRIDESLETAVTRRLGEELGIRDIKLTEIIKLQYCCRFENSLMENEIDHVFQGRYDGNVTGYNANEVEQVAWLNFDFLKKDVFSNSSYTLWFKLIMVKLAEEGYPT